MSRCATRDRPVRPHAGSVRRYEDADLAAASARLGGRHVPAELDRAAERALVVLRLVLELDVGVAQRHLLGDLAAAGGLRVRPR